MPIGAMHDVSANACLLDSWRVGAEYAFRYSCGQLDGLLWSAFVGEGDTIDPPTLSLQGVMSCRHLPGLTGTRDSPEHV